MHDWTLVSISMEWSSSVLTIELLDTTSTSRQILAHGVRGAHLRHDEPWGPSVSVLGHKFSEVDGGVRLQIETQSGDLIDIEAEKIHIP